MLDNTSSNNKICETVESLHALRQLPAWSTTENQLPCLEHIVNLATVDVMKHVTRFATLENATAIWEYDPSDDNNRVLGGSLDMIVAMCTLAIKVCIYAQTVPIDILINLFP